jgi:pyruvate dehydrogenase E2 component (dihydrolipoamide acetyltransferase)
MDILMPQLGETVDQGKIIKWYKAVGDTIGAGEILFEIETDKVSMEVPSLEAGRVTDIRVQAGESAPVGATVAVVGGEPQGASAPAHPPTIIGVPAAPEAATAAPVPAERDPFNAVVSPTRNFGPVTLPHGVKITPLARRLAAQHGVDLTGRVGSGPHGRLLAKDVEALAQSAGRPAASPATVAEVALQASPYAGAILPLYAGRPFEEIALDGMRRTIARRLVESKQTVPHFYLIAHLALDGLLQLRQDINARGQVRISVNDLIVKAFALALQRVPTANAVWAEDRILRFAEVDVGVAVSVDGGLFTPVVRNAAGKSLSTLSAEIRDLAERARSRGLQPQEYQGGAATVSNLGMHGVSGFSAIINPPQSSILAVGAAERRAFESEDGAIRFGSAMTVTLSCDHRVVDGALGAELLKVLKTLVEDPITLLL